MCMVKLIRGHVWAWPHVRGGRVKWDVFEPLHYVFFYVVVQLWNCRLGHVGFSRHRSNVCSTCLKCWFFDHVKWLHLFCDVRESAPFRLSRLYLVCFMNAPVIIDCWEDVDENSDSLVDVFFPCWANCNGWLCLRWRCMFDVSPLLARTVWSKCDIPALVRRSHFQSSPTHWL